MGGDEMDIMEFLRESIKKNEEEAKQYLMEENKLSIMKLSSNNGLPKHFRDKTLDNFHSSINLQALKAAKDFVANFPHAKGILFTGDVGLGKTHLAAAITNELNNRLYSSYFGNATDIVSFCKSTYNRQSLLTEVEAINIMTDKVDLLIIDDLGKEYSTENTLAILYQIINRLYENEKPVIITTNFNSNDLRVKLGSRGYAIISRITAMCTPVVLKGKDWRTNRNV